MSRNRVLTSGLLFLALNLVRASSEGDQGVDAIAPILALCADPHDVYQISPHNPPSPRMDHSVSLLGSRLYVFGGRIASASSSNQGSPLLGDIHFYDVPSGIWSGPLIDEREGGCGCCVNGAPVGSAPPIARARHLAVADESTGSIWIFGGEGPEFDLGDLHRWSNEELRWSGAVRARGIPPSPRSSPSGSIFGGYLWVFGGYLRKSDTYAHDLYRLRLSDPEWERLDFSSSPQGRKAAQFVQLPTGKLLVAGGLGPDAAPLLDAWFLTTGEVPRWTRAPVVLGARFGGGALFHERTGGILLVGGLNAGGDAVAHSTTLVLSEDQQWRVIGIDLDANLCAPWNGAEWGFAAAQGPASGGDIVYSIGGADAAEPMSFHVFRLQTARDGSLCLLPAVEAEEG
jgi:hypothetical protein